ncbi:hypothetical protein ElyMa_000337500, partial [Elysia marginata]
RIGFTASELNWLTDNNDATCKTGSSQSVTVTLNTAIPLTWVRVVLNDAGRNVALKQTAQQSSRYYPAEAPDSYRAENAVDGRVGDSSRYDARLTCTHTLYEENPDWWTVYFTQAADVTRFLVYNRNGNEMPNWVFSLIMVLPIYSM